MKQIILLLFLIALFAAGSAEAVDYYISPTGSDANSCAQAQNSATPKQHFQGATGGFSCMSAGDRLILRGGTYDEGHAIDFNGDTFTPGLPSGTSDNNRTTITVFPGETARIQPSANPNFAGVMVFLNGSTKNWITIDGGTKCGRGTTGACRLILDGSIINNGALFFNGAASNIRLTGVEILQTGPVDCGSVDCGSNGVQGGGTNFEIRDSNIHNVGITSGVATTGGYCFYTAPSAGLTGIVIDNNLIHHCGGYGIHQNSQTHFPGPLGMVVSNNEVYANGQSATQEVDGVLVRFCDGCAVFNNIIRDQVGVSTGLQVGPANINTTRVYSNTIVRNPRAGLIIDHQSSGAFDVKNNILKDNNLSNTGRLNIEEANGTGATFATNLCHGTGGSANCSSTSDPLFVDAANNDFRLQAGSPAVNVGTTLGAPYNVDAAGTSRPQGSFYDLGLFERASASCPSTPAMLVAQYSFDGVATDSSGNGNNGSLGAGASYDTGKYNQGLLLTGAGGVTVTDANSLDLCNGMTLAAWVKPSSIAADSAVVVKNPSSKYFLFSSITGYCGTSMPMGGYSQGSIATACHATQLTTDIWTHLTLTWDGTTITLYKNGTAVTNGPGVAALDATTGTLQIGTSGFSEHFTGMIDEVRIYNYARSPSQVVTDMNTPINTVTPTQKLLVGSGSLKMGASATAMKMEGLQ